MLNLKINNKSELIKLIQSVSIKTIFCKDVNNNIDAQDVIKKIQQSVSAKDNFTIFIVTASS
jgi:hypothetical protein